MGFELVLYALLFIIWLIFVYGVYKLIWYVVKMFAFKRYIKDIGRHDITVEPQREFSDIIFGKKGPADYIITAGNKKYEVSVLSFASTHGRWNIEKTRTSFYIECRRASRVFKAKHVNSSLPDHVIEYKGESRVSRKELFITPINDSFDKQIFLIYPYPAQLTYTDAHYNRLYSGDTVEGHVIMNVEDFDNLLFDGKQ